MWNNKKDLDIQAQTTNSFQLKYLNIANNHIKLRKASYVARININYVDVTKEDIYFKLVKLLDHEVDKGNFFVYETNVTNIDLVKTSYIEQLNDGVYCFLMKYEESKPLYYICTVMDSGKFTIGTKGFTDNNLHYKYNFILPDGTNDETITVSENYNTVISGFIYPETIDFNKKDSYEIFLVGEKTSLLNNIRLNENGGNLACTDIRDDIKKCSVPRSHFDGKSGIFFIRHKNSLNKYVVDYPLGRINVNFGKINNYSFGLIFLVCLILL